MANSWKQELIEALQGNDLVQAQKTTASNIPKKLYKHFSISDNTFDTLEKGAVWLSDPSSFNDPYDSATSLISETMQPGWEEEMDITSEQLSAINTAKEIFEMAKHQDDLKQIRRALRVCCFSELNNSILMWSHYADEHKGICVEYDLTSLVSTTLPPKWFLYPMIYSETLFDVNPYMNETNIHPLSLMLCSLYKSDEWSYEKEWRLITAPVIMPKAGHMQIPQPTAIYLGSRIKTEHRQTLKEFAFRKEIKLFKTDFDPLKFRMHFSEITVSGI